MMVYIRRDHHEGKYDLKTNQTNKTSIIISRGGVSERIGQPTKSNAKGTSEV
jgi:hypothetical protein